MTDPRHDIDARSAPGARRDARLTLDVTFGPGSVTGAVRREGAAIPFDGWLGLAQAVCTAVGVDSGTASIAGPPLLGEDVDPDRGVDPSRSPHQE